eukprot:6755911-Pyramimonas_sp.AAC.2
MGTSKKIKDDEAPDAPEGLVKRLHTSDKESCPLDFPERFFAACSFAMNPPEKAKGVSDDTRLLLYALYQQSVDGNCNTFKPWGWNRFETLKWNAWNELKDMPSMDAMMMYVATLEEDNKDWWMLLTDSGDKAKSKEVCLQ